ncbi:MAG: hypothetical protein ACLKAK_13035 [Alkaliphilus sp.]
MNEFVGNAYSTKELTPTCLMNMCLLDTGGCIFNRCGFHDDSCIFLICGPNMAFG